MISWPERLNIADHFLDARIREGHGDRVALWLDDGPRTYSEVRREAHRWAHLLSDRGLRPEDRVMIALPDGLDFVAALFGTLELGGVVVMVNPDLEPDALTALFAYTRVRAVVVDARRADAFRQAAEAAHPLCPTPDLVEVGSSEVTTALAAAPDAFETFPTHADDPALWLFSGGTTGTPKAVVQTHRSFANTTELYAVRTLGYGPDDVTISVPKLFFGYATGSNLFFPFAVGASAVLFEDKPTSEGLFERIARHRATILINVPTMIQRMLGHAEEHTVEVDSLRFATSAGEALPVPLYHRWKEHFGVELLDGLGTAEMWHIFVTNRPGDVHPGTLGKVVEGFELKVCDAEGAEVGPDEVGQLWVRGDSRALGYWQNLDKTRNAFRGEWFVGGDLVQRNADGVVTYCGRGDDVLKVAGKWLAPSDVESCLMRHPRVDECAVVGVEDGEGLMKPIAFVRSEDLGEAPGDDAIAELADQLKAFTLEHLQAYKHPRRVIVLDDFPRTHLGKIDRGKLKGLAKV